MPPIPSSIDSEACLLASMIENNASIEKIQAGLTDDAFHNPHHRLLYTTICDVYNKLKKVDLVLIKDELGQRILEVGGYGYLASIIENAPDLSIYEPYLNTVFNKWKLRQAYKLAQEIVDKSDAGTTLEEVYRIADNIKAVSNIGDHKDLTVLLNSSVTELDDIRTSGKDLLSGFKQLDLALGGLRRGKLYTIGGKTSHGKTTFALNLALHNLLANPKTKVLYNAFEDIDQIPYRLTALEAGVKLEWFLNPETLPESDYVILKQKLMEEGKHNDRLRIVGGVSCARMRGICDEMKPDIVIVDYLQRYAHKFNLADEGRLSHEIGKAVSDLQDLAIDKRVAVVLLSQFSRRSEEHRFRRPQLEDLKESGDIEFLSDAVILLWWQWRDDGRKQPTDYLILLDKNKLGPRLEQKAFIDIETLRLTEKRP